MPINAVPNSGHFQSWYTGLGAQKMAQKWSSTLSKSIFFIKQLTNTFLLCEIYQNQDFFDTYI